MIYMFLNFDGIVLDVELVYYVCCIGGVGMFLIVVMYVILNGIGFFV